MGAASSPDGWAMQLFIVGHPMSGWTKRDVVIDGRKIAAREAGDPADGTLVLLHGLGAHQRSWDRVVKGLGGFRVVTLDYAGHGKSDPLDHYSVDRLLDDLTHVIDDLGVRDDYVIVGHSIGADLALLHAAHRKPRGLVLVDGALLTAPPETDWERFSIMEDRLIFKILMFVGRRVGSAPAMSVQQIRSLTEDLEARRRDFSTLLSSLNVPAVYVIGDRADKVPNGQLIHERKMSSAGEIHSRYGVSVEYVPCGHFVPMHQPERLSNIIRDFATVPS